VPAAQRAPSERGARSPEERDAADPLDGLPARQACARRVGRHFAGRVATACEPREDAKGREGQGGEPQRVTFDGSYNANPRISPDGKSLAFVHREDGNLHIAVMDLASGTLQTITDGELDKSPSFAPNGSMIIFEANYRGQGVLQEVSVDGQVHERLSERQAGEDVHAPVWGPFQAPGQ